MRLIVSLFAAAGFIAALYHAPAHAQQLWEPPGQAVSLTEEQNQAVKALSDSMGQLMAYLSGERCHVTANGKCPDTGIADVTQKNVIEQYIAEAQKCAAASDAVRASGVPDTQPIEFDLHHQPDFDSPMAQRNTKHFCNLVRGVAERHAVFFDRNIGGTVFTDYKAQSAASEVGTSVTRLTYWYEIYACYQRSEQCEAQPSMREIDSLNSWVRDAEGCLADIKTARDAEVSDDYPIDFTPNSIGDIKSPDTLAAAEAYCIKSLDVAKAAAAQLLAETTPEPPVEPVVEPVADPNQLSESQQKIIGDLYQNSPQVVAAIDAHTNPNSANADDLKSQPIVEFWVQNAKECQALAGAALQAGVPGDYPFEFPTYDSGLRSPMPLAQYDEEICAKAQSLSQATLNNMVAKEQAVVAPYLAVLKGDRLRLFKEHNLHTRSVRGPGGQELRTPEDFLESPAWYTTSEDNSAAAGPRWLIGGWQFDGDRVLRNYSDTDWGREPPSNRYPTVRDGSGSGNSGGGFFGFILWLVYIAIFVAVIGAIGLAAYTYFNLKIAAVENLLNKVPAIRGVLAKLPKQG